MVRFDDRVALVTGAGRGLGRSHALLLASRGAKVVVNDVGTTLTGERDESIHAADEVVEQIRTAGGDAVASYEGVDTIDGAEGVVRTALETFGRIDVVVNNAGILRNAAFADMTADDWDKLVAVHLAGAMLVTKAAWPLMCQRSYGRIVFTTASAGLYGNPGQAAYGAAKLGLVALAKTLGQEGAARGIKANAIAPVALSRMTESILPAEAAERLTPGWISPLVAYLCSEQLAETGQVYAVGGGYVSRVAIVEGAGVTFDIDQELTPEAIAEQWTKINDLSQVTAFADALEASSRVMDSALR